MSDYIHILLYVIASAFKLQRHLAAENIALRYQIMVLRRKYPGRPKLTGADRSILVWLSRVAPPFAMPLLSSNRRPWCAGILILRMARENPLWGAPRIHGELLKLGFDLAQSTVSNHLRRDPRPRDQTWKAFIANHKDAMAAIDLFVVPTVGFKLLYGIAILHLKRRELIWTNATMHPTTEWTAQQITEALPWDEAPSHIIRDRDVSYGFPFKRRLDAMGFATTQLRPDRLGRTVTSSGSLARSAGSASTTPSFSVSHTCIRR